MNSLAVFIIALVVGLVKADADSQQCFRTAMFNAHCCQFNVTQDRIETLKECAKLTSRDPESCEFESCFAIKIGFLLSDGTIDKSALAGMLEEDFENSEDILGAVKEKCITDDLSFYGPPKMCDVKKIGNCIKIQNVLNCPQWADTEHCKEVQDKLEECQSVFP